MIAEHVRDAAMTAVILGFFTSVWLGWAQDRRRPVLARDRGLRLLAVDCHPERA